MNQNLPQLVASKFKIKKFLSLIAAGFDSFLSLFLIMDAEAYADTGPVILLFLSQKEKLNKLFLDF